MVLGDVLPRRPLGLNDLQDLMADKERIEVLYDPSGTQTSFEGTRVRVLPATPDLRADRLRRVVRKVAIGYGPAVVLVGLGLIISRLRAKRMGCWLGPSLFFLCVQPLFALFVIVTELFQ